MINAVKKIIDKKDSFKNVFDCYESCKKELEKQGLSPAEHLTQIKEITKELDI